MQTYKARNDSTKAPPSASTRTTFVDMTENTGEELHVCSGFQQVQRGTNNNTPKTKKQNKKTKRTSTRARAHAHAISSKKIDGFIIINFDC